MNKFYLSLLFAVACLLNATAAMTPDFYARRSILSEGKWVKVGVEHTGVYEISYETLRQMGFADPSKVCIFGRGGYQLSPSFINGAGALNISDDLTQVRTLHFNNTLYFYALGTENISFRYQSSHNFKGYYERKSKNIYSDKGYYFLTDSKSALQMANLQPSNLDAVKERTSAITYLYHEKDLYHNTTKTGNLFYGEKLLKPNGTPSVEWDADLRKAIPGEKAFMHLDFYIEKEMPNTILSYGMVGGTSNPSFQVQDYYSSNFVVQEPSESYIDITPGHQKIFVGLETSEAANISNIDYWTLNYMSEIPSPSDKPAGEAAQTRFAFTDLTRTTNIKFRVPDGSSYIALDVTTPTTPKRMISSADGGDAIFKVYGSTSYADIVVFDTSRPQLQISGYENAYESVANQNLHQYGEEGADLLIICIPRLKNLAERLAEIHRQKDGIKVVVATSEECYNEFSQGVPDPMAYRSIARMLYEGKTKLKNMILMGPLYADFRGITQPKDPREGLIAYQDYNLSMTNGAFNANDYYGMMADFITPETLERETMHIGVGLLPFHYENEADIYLTKLESYLNDDTYAYHLNKVLTMSCEGDSHAHDNQSKDILTWINNLEHRSTIGTIVNTDTYGYSEARKKIIQTLDQGTTFMLYFGHGAAHFLGKNRFFFTTSDVSNLTNKVMPLSCFAGCNLSNTDRGRAGLGEIIATNVPYGSIASIIATRDTWSGQNMELFRSLFTCFYRTSDSTSSPMRTETPTAGEVFAAAKSSSSFNNELGYQFIGDPAIRIPLAHESIALDTETPNAVNGEYVTLTGYIANSDGTVDTNFNGDIVVRLMEPIKNIPCPNLISNETQYSPTLPFADIQVTMTAGTVVDGKFEVEMQVPASAAEFDTRIGRLHLSAYSKERHLGAGSMLPMTYVRNTEVSSEEKDTEAPVFTRFEFDADSNTATIALTDNYAMSFMDTPFNQGYSLFIDGKDLGMADAPAPKILDNGKGWERTFSMNNLSYGNHTLRLIARDAAGNTAEKEIAFDYAPKTPDFEIYISSNPSDDDVVFNFPALKPEKATIYILDADGNQVFSSEFSGDEFSWNRITSYGTKAAHGHYKAYILEKSAHSSKGHSATVDVPLI